MVTSAGVGKAAPFPPTFIKIHLTDWLGCYLLTSPLPPEPVQGKERDNWHSWGAVAPPTFHSQAAANRGR